MSCVLRISGTALDVEAMLIQYPLPVNRVWKKAEPRFLNGRLHADSGATVVVSDAEFDQFDVQITQATEFLEFHAGTIANIVGYPGVEAVVFDFGVALFEDSVMMSSYLPPDFIRLAANARTGVMLSHYAQRRW